MDYGNIATTVFTPLEYGSIGLAEEEAIQKYGANKIEVLRQDYKITINYKTMPLCILYFFHKVYHSNFWPLEWTIAKKPNNVCYAKIICNKADKVK